MKSRSVMRLLSIAVICTFLPNGMVWGALQPPLSKIPVPKPNLAEFVKDEAAAIRLGKALFWDMQVGSDGVTACASCHYRAGADPVVGTGPAPKDTFKRDRNQLHPGPDTIFGNNSTVIITFKTAPGIDPLTGLPDPVPIVDPVTLLPVPFFLRATEYLLDPLIPGVYRFAPNYTLDTQLLGDFPLFNVIPQTARLVIDPLTGLTSDAVSSLRDTNDVVGSQGVRLAQFTGINPNSALDNSSILPDPLFRLNGANIRQVTGRNTPSVINAVFNYSNFWDGRANNIFNGETPFGPLDQNAGIWIDNGAALVKQKIAIPNSSLASQAVGPALSDVEMSFKGRTFPEIGRKMLARAPLANQFVHPQDSVLGALSNAQLQNGTLTGNRGININSYRTMVEAAFVNTLWNSGNRTTLNTVNGPVQFDQIEANFSLFWGLAIQLYEATLVSDRTPFDRFQLGNQNALSPDQVNNPTAPSAVRGFGLFDSKCAVCHSGPEFSSAVVGSNNCNPATLVIDPNACNAVAFTNNSSHKLIKQDVNIEVGAPPPGLIDAGFFNIGVRPTADDPGRGGNAPSGLPLSFTQLGLQAADLPFVTPKLPLILPAKVQGAFKTPGLRNVELTAPYFHNGDALTLDQVVEFYTRGGNFPGNPELAAAMQPIGNLRNAGGVVRKADIVAFLMTLTDERVRNETAPFDHPELLIPNGVNGADASIDAMITLDATGGAAPDVLINNLTFPAVASTNLTSLLLSGTVDETATVAVDVTNTTTGVSLPTAAAIVGGTVAGVVGGIVQPPTDWSINLTGLTPGSITITVTATSETGSTIFAAGNPSAGNPATFTQTIQITPTATISGAPSGDGTKLNNATLTIAGVGVNTYQYSLDGGAFNGVDIPVAEKIVLTGLPDGPHSVAVLAKDVGGNQQLIASTAAWRVKANPPVLTIDPFAKPTKKTSLTISGTAELSQVIPTVTVAPPAIAGTVKTFGGNGIATWSCDITGLVPGTNNIKVTMLDFVFNQTDITDVITVVVPDGNMKGTGTVDVSDALRALRIAVGIVSPTFDDLMRGDVAPLVNGKPAPDDTINVSDAVVILKKAVGLVNF